VHVALVCLAGNTRTALQDAITSAGHTYDDVAEGDLGTIDIDDYDVLVVGLTTQASFATFGPQIRALHDAGLPLLLSMVDSSSGDQVTAQGIPTSIGLVNSGATARLDQASFSASANIEILDNSHAITTGLSTGLVQVNLSNSRQKAPRDETSAGWIGATASKLADAQGSGFSGPNLANKAGLIAVEAGANDLLSNPIGARLVMCSWLFASGSGGAYHANGKALIANALNWLFVPGDPLDSDLAPPTIEVVGEGDTFFTTYFASDPPAGVTGLRVRYHPDSGQTVLLDRVLFDPDDSSESWRYQLVTDLTLGESGYAEAIWIGEDGVSAWSDPVPFALFTEAAEQDTPISSDEEPGEVEVFTQSPQLEWPWASYSGDVLWYIPTFDYTNLIRRNTEISGPGITGSLRVDFYPHPGTQTVPYDFLQPGGTYTINEWAIYTLAGRLRSSPVRAVVLEVPQALAPPRIISPAPGGILAGGSGVIVAEEEASGSLLPGTDRFEITRGDGVYTTLGEVDSELSSPPPLQLPADWLSFAGGPCFLSVRRITSDGTTERRIAGPFIIDNEGYGARLDGGQLEEYDIFGTANEDDRWSETVDPESSEPVMQRAGGIGAGHLAVKSVTVGDAMDVITVGKYASATGGGNWFQYTPDMQSHFGAGAFISGDHRFLASRFRGWIGATGTASGQSVGIGKFSQWDTGLRLGKGVGQQQIVVHDGVADSYSIKTTPSSPQWCRNNRYGDVRHAVMTRVELVGTLLDGSKRYRVRDYMTGPDNESEAAALPRNDVTQDMATLAGAPGITTVAGSASAVLWIYSHTYYGGEPSAPPDEDIGTQPLPGWRVPGEWLIQLDPSIDWASLAIPGVIIAEDGSAWLDYAWLPVYQ
jgi:hypothetical protein